MELKAEQTQPHEEAIVHNNVHANNNNTNNSGLINAHHVVGMDIRRYLDSFPPGIRFCPFDDELIVHYLKNKILNQPLPPNKIQIVDLYRYTPQTLTEMHPGLREHKGVVVGLRKDLVFYEGISPFGEETSWIMHEYRIDATHHNADDMRLDDWVLCRVFKKGVGKDPQQDDHQEVAPLTESVRAETKFWDSGEDSEHELLVNSDGCEQLSFARF